jgi:hypothetical protein
MSSFKKFITVFSLLTAAVTAHAQPGITSITFTDTAMSATGSWPIGHEWYIGAILTDSAGHVIGSLTPTLINLNTGSAASYPIGFTVTLGAAAPADAIVNIYRSTGPFVAGDQVERAEFDGLCNPAGCPAGPLSLPMLGALPNPDFKPDNTAMPVTLQSYSVD